jgi:hypothetical protein
MALWIELQLELSRAYELQQEGLIARLYEYAWWCWKATSADVRTAVAFAFYEHLPTNPTTREDLPRRLGPSAFAELRDVFRYHLLPDEIDAFEREFLERERAYVKSALARRRRLARRAHDG